MRSDEGVRLGVRVAFRFVRGLERLLPPQSLYHLLAPVISARVAFKRTRPSLPLPACLGRGNFQITKKRRRNDFLNATLEFFPDKLATAKWLPRLEIDGREYLESALLQKRPVMLAFSHFGPYELLRCWLRAAGFPVAMMVAGSSQNRSGRRRLQDRVSPFPEIPIALYREDQLRESIDFVNAGHPLLIAIDVLNNKKMDVPVDADWQCGMATGAFRLARRAGAVLIPCSVVDVGHWNFRITLSPPVPAELLAAGDLSSAGKYVLEAFLPAMRAHPEQASERLIKLFQRVRQ